jgi:hypothetical protein
VTEISLEQQWREPPHRAFPDVTWAALKAELQRELAARRSLYPQLVDKGRLTSEASARGQAIIAAMILDLTRRLCPPWPRRAADPPGHDCSWSDRRDALVAELAQRERLYPDWIAKGRLEVHTARHRNSCLEALLCVYEDGFDWRASNGARPMFAKWENRTAAEDQAMAEWAAHWQAVEARRHPPQQNELELG